MPPPNKSKPPDKSGAPNHSANPDHQVDPEIQRSPYYFPIKRPVAITMAVLTAFVFGILSYRLLPISMMPEISYPSLTIRVEHPGAAPEEVESVVARPLEQALGVVRGLVEMSSSSRAEVCDILLEFDWDTDMNRATQDVREKLDVIFLPDEVKPPLILRYDPSLDPIIRIGLTSDSLNLLNLRNLTEEVIKRELDKLTGVAAVKVKGGEEVEIRVAIDAAKLDLLDISTEQILQRLAAENVNLAGGHLQEGESEYIIRTLNEFGDIGEIADIVIELRGDHQIRLKDVATVARITKEQTTITRVAGKESVEIEIFKESDANPILVSDLVKRVFYGMTGRKEVEKEPTDKGKSKGEHRRRGIRPLAERLTDRIEIHFLSNQAEFIKRSVQHVRSSAIIGGILAVIVLMLFLGRLQDTIAVAIVIPVSLVCAFAAMHIAKVTINIMSLGGLALGVGMMVDNAIVVIESIHRRREKGDSPTSAAVIGTRTVGGAVTASTLTTIVVFFPIVFVTGVAGQVFGDMALTVIISLSVSLFVALFFIPMIVTRWMGGSKRGMSREWRPPAMTIGQPWYELKASIIRWKQLRWWARWLVVLLFLPFILPYLLLRVLIGWMIWLSLKVVYILFKIIRLLYLNLSRLIKVSSEMKWIHFGSFFRKGIERLTDGYVYILKRLLLRPWMFLFGILVICVISYGWLLPQLGGELIPSVSQGTFDVELSLPIGTPLERTADVILPVEQTISAMLEVLSVSSRIGGDLITAETDAKGPHNAVVTVLLRPGGDIEAKEQQIVEAIRAITSEIPSLVMRITHPTLFTFKQPLEIILKDNDLDRLRRRGSAVEDRLSRLDILADVESTLRPGYPEVAVHFDRDRLARLGLTARNAADRVKTAVLGNVPTRYREEERRIDIRVQLAKKDRETLDELGRMIINPGQQIPVTLSEVARLVLREGPAEIRRVSGTRAA
ncbi:MAG: efflux RND transporter permease subunit, partial [Candidatus Electryoneaceae bacterium]|nr:efflux RND transporter permease subunit [Candidatus Electryoneaceae bacterium]